MVKVFIAVAIVALNAAQGFAGDAPWTGKEARRLLF